MVEVENDRKIRPGIESTLVVWQEYLDKAVNFC